MNHPCLLRHGIEVNYKQSFIACIADALFFARKNDNGELYRVPTIKEMKNIIIKTLTIENFLKYQNGNLIANSSKIKNAALNATDISLQAIATVAAGQPIDIRWKVETGTTTLANRILTIIKVR